MKIFSGSINIWSRSIPRSDVGIMTIDVLDYDRHRAHAINQTIVAEAEKFMNDMNATMQAQTMNFARKELENAVKAVRAAKDPAGTGGCRDAAYGGAAGAGRGGRRREPAVGVHRADFRTVAPDGNHQAGTPVRYLVDHLHFGAVYAVGFLMWSNVRDHRKA